MRLSLTTPPGTGTWSPTELVAHRLGLPRISAGDVLKVHVQTSTQHGREAKRYMNANLLIPEPIISQMMDMRLAQDDAADGFVLHNYPRTVRQADTMTLDVFGYFLMDVGPMAAHFEAMRSCRGCHRQWHLQLDNLKDPSVCGRCGDRLLQREDFRYEAVEQRLNTHYAQTELVFHHYAARAKVFTVRASVAEDHDKAVDAAMAALASL